MTRTWADADRVALRELVDEPWLLGTVTGETPEGYTIVRLDDKTNVRLVHPDDVRLRPEHEVPVDERHWLPEKVRDQLVRQEAAERLRELWRALPDDCVGDVLLDVAYRLAGFDAHGGPDPNPAWAASARALLAPAPAPATTP